MTAPLTRRDVEEILDQRLENVATKDDLKNYPTKDDLKNALANYPTKDDLKNALANYPTKDDLKNALANYPTNGDLAQFGVELRADIAADTAAAIRVISEENRAWFRAIDDQHKDLPERVRKLEEAVIPPPPRTRRRKSG